MLLDQVETYVMARAQFAEYSGQARQRASDLMQQIDALKTGDVRFSLHSDARGLAIYAMTPRGMYLVIVVAANKGEGDGTHIMDMLKKTCREMKGRRRILITLPECLQTTQGFYRRLGFEGRGRSGTND